MKQIFLIMIVGGLLFSCRTPKQSSVVEQLKEQQELPLHHDDNYFYLGEVQLLDCGVVLQVNYEKVNYKYSPVNLDPKWKIDKLRLKLKFKVLDQRATECSEFQAIEVTEAFAVR